MKKKRKKWIIVVLVLVVAAVAVWLWSVKTRTQAAAYTEMEATAGDLTTYYNFDGQITAPVSQTLTVAASDTVKTVYVKQNQHVQKGDRLYRLGDGLTVEAEIDGEVTGLYIEEDGLVNAGDVTVQIIDLDRLQAELDIDEYDIGAVALGTQAEISVLALDGQWTGEVSAIDKNGVVSGDLSYYTVTVDLPEGTGVYPGMQVSAKVLRDQVQDAVLLKMDAIQFDEYNEPFVYMRASNGRDVVQVPVEVGVTDGLYCQITEGLRAGDTVLVPSGMSLAELMQQMQEIGR